LTQSYDGNGLRVKKNDNGTVTYYLRSTVLGGQVVAEMNSTGGWTRGYVYLGSQLLAVQQGGVYWMHEDPVTKSKRVTNSAGAIVSTIELDPWGADTPRSNNAAFQPKKYTSYDRDGNASDEAMFRRYNRWHSRFDQPDPYEGSYDFTNPQSFNRYSYVNNDPVNTVDPSGLEMEATGGCSAMFSSCAGTGGGGYEGTPFDSGSYFMGGYNDLPGRTGGALRAFDHRVQNTRDGLRAQDALNHNDFELLISILNRNPNVGVSVNSVPLWGQLGAAFISGYSKALADTKLASVGFFGLGGLLARGWRAVANLLSKRRSPDFKILNIQAVAGFSRFIAKGDDMSTALHGITGGAGVEGSFAVGWMVQMEPPLYKDIIAWGTGFDVSGSSFVLIGGGIIFSPQRPSIPGVVVGVGVGGKGINGSFTYKPW
jgi:RHS repeat-associated protein